MKHSIASGTLHAVSHNIKICFLNKIHSLESKFCFTRTYWYTGRQFWIQSTLNVHTLTTDTPLTLGSVFISGSIIGSWSSSSSSSFILETISVSIPVPCLPTRDDVTHVSLEEPSSYYIPTIISLNTKVLASLGLSKTKDRMTNIFDWSHPDVLLSIKYKDNKIQYIKTHHLLYCVGGYMLRLL